MAMEEGKGKACAVAKEKLLNCIMKSDCFQKVHKCVCTVLEIHRIH